MYEKNGQFSNELSSLHLHLKNIEERDNLLFERNLAFSVVIRSDGKILNANKAFLTNLNYLKGEIVGRPLINFIVEDQRKDFLAQFERCFKGEYPSELEVGIYAKDGSVKTILFSSTQLLFQEENNPQSILVSGVDITVRKKAEEELKKSYESSRIQEEKIEQVCRELEHLSITDSLTGLYNHRYFMQTLRSEAERFHRHGNPLCLLMFDVDDLKSYNDVYGHLEGDQLLKEVGRAVKESLRVLDVVCRYGGDEFMVILPETSMLQVKVVAEKIKQAVSNLRLKRAAAISMGIATCHKDMNVYDFILKTDQALYQAKKENKGGICCLT